MQYTLRRHVELGGDTIPLLAVAEGMARHAASAFGTGSIHHPTLKNTREIYSALLTDAATRGLLTVCDTIGRILPPGEVEAMHKSFTSSSEFLVTLFVRSKHLIDWGSANGDEFNVEEVPAEEIVFDLKNDKSEIVKKGYFRGFIGIVSDVTPLPDLDDDAISVPTVPLITAQPIPEPPVPPIVAPSIPPVLAQPILRAQELKIMEWLDSNGYKNGKLPKRENGKGTAKTLARKALHGKDVFEKPSTFNKAWERLRAGGEVKEIE
nr:hypothetical protein [uncultured Noviherbaspirillum sp.]